LKKLPKQAIVVFDGRYGNTEKVAKSLQNGFIGAGNRTACFNENEVQIESLKQYDLIADRRSNRSFSRIQIDERLSPEAKGF
jgi:flavodoxin